MKNILQILTIQLLLVCLPVTVQAADELINLEKEGGAALYKEKCGMCHLPGGMGVGILARRMSPELALLENRDDLQGPFIETVIRSGFGIMFPISRGEVSDKQLQAISDYLVKED